MAGAFSGIEAFDQSIIDGLEADEVTASYNIRGLADGLLALIEGRPVPRPRLDLGYELVIRGSS